jgi:hypothetical protein
MKQEDNNPANYRLLAIITPRLHSKSLLALTTK